MQNLKENKTNFEAFCSQLRNQGFKYVQGIFKSNFIDLTDEEIKHNE